jgi:hypothetical protein
MVFLWCSYGFSEVLLWFPNIWMFGTGRSKHPNVWKP